MIYTWIVAFLLSIILEAIVPGLVAIWFAPGALVAFVLALLNVNVWVQVVVFICLAFLSIILARYVFKITRISPNTKTNIDAIVGKTGVVTEHIDNLAGCGQVKVDGMFWSARLFDETEEIEVGSPVNIVAIEGVKLIVKKK